MQVCKFLMKKSHRFIGGLAAAGLFMVLSACGNQTDSASKEPAVKQTEEASQTAGVSANTKEAENHSDQDNSIEGVLSEAKAKKTVDELMSGIVGTFRDSGEKYRWSNYNNPANFDVLQPELLNYASESFTDGFLRETASDYYCECDQRFFPDTSLDVRFTLHKSTNQMFAASSIEFINDMGDGGNTVYYTVVKENGKWVMDDIKWVAPEKEPMNVTWDELQAYEKQFDPKVELLNESKYDGRKIYIIRYPELDQIKGVYADNTEILYDVPNELLPEALQEKESSEETEEIAQEDASGENQEVTEEAPSGDTLTPEQAEQLVRDHLGFTNQPDISVVYDHDTEEGHYNIHVYKILDKGTEFEHNSTYGWYGVVPETGEIYDSILEGM
ncbi:hypothetical protein QYG89_07610 [Bacillus sp. B190/17]|uniref:Uncharacterized protein n=1 Tax=Bacillus lumedeiriae TaxID=3058829 RepID=A0ABW8I7R8_9BACI